MWNAVFAMQSNLYKKCMAHLLLVTQNFWDFHNTDIICIQQVIINEILILISFL